jgi:catechol 2,3-dioxygenase-like lactoylglutathione lyase family enzyme
MDFLHVGMKVDNIHKSSLLYGALFGIEWEPIKEHQLIDVTLDGAITPSRTLVTHGKTVSGFEIEMIQIVEGHTADEIALGTREGLSHFGFTVPDLDAAVEVAQTHGLRKVSEYRSEYVDFVFLDGDDLGGALTQLIHFNQPRQ